MNILHVAESIDPSQGGPSICIPSIAAAQAKLGHNVSIISYITASKNNYTSFLKYNIPDYENINFIGIDNQTKLEQFFATKGRQAIKKKLTGLEAIHLHGLWRPLLKIAATLAIRNKIALIITPHGMLDPWSMEQKKYKKKIALWLGWQTILNKCTFLHALNREEKKLLYPLNLRCKIKIFPNGVFRQNYLALPDKGAFYKRHPALNNSPYILFLSRLHFKKGLDYLIDAFAEFSTYNNKFHLVIAGPNDGAKSMLMNKIKEYKLSDKVHLVGALYEDDKFSALIDANCFCLPSRQEGFSIAITEALAVGTPVIISENCNFPEVSNARAGLIFPLQQSGIVSAMKTISELSDFDRSEMSENARKLVFENYDWSSISLDILNALNHNNP